MEQITEQDKQRRTGAWEHIKEGYIPPMTPTDYRSAADKHGRKADQLVSGDAKDSHIVAEKKHNQAGDAIDAAHLATRKAEAFD